MTRRWALVIVAVIASLLAAAPALAHPLGNFTTNVHLGVHVEEGRLEVRLVLDMAEIPAFREASDEDGYPARSCRSALDDLEVRVDGVELPLVLGASTVLMPLGVGGLRTLRLECSFSGSPGEGFRVIEVDNRVYSDRLGWAEIVVTGGMSEAPAVSPTRVLTSYPDGDLMNLRTAVIEVGSTDPGPSPTGLPTRPHGSGVIGWLSGLTASAGDALALVAAIGLGVAHALAPGHGKTLMAAYLVGRGGGARHAMLLGLSVAVAHTVGVAVLGLATLAAANTFQPDRILPWLSWISAGIITTIGLTMLVRVRRNHRHRHDHAHDHGHDHAHDHDHDVTPTGWRSLAALGLAGGIVPSASAVVLLLAGIGAGRPGFGLLMVAAFGVGMSLALVGAGLAIVGLYRMGGRHLSASIGPRLGRLVPRVAAAAVTGVGLFMMAGLLRSV
jgi:ABC-type nickel/cobalt efflux system permease component RcnA